MLDGGYWRKTTIPPELYSYVVQRLTRFSLDYYVVLVAHSVVMPYICTMRNATETRTMTKTTIKIERPDGKIETVDVSATFRTMTDALFADIRRSTAAAGRGKALSYKVVRADNRTDAERAWVMVDAKRNAAERAMGAGDNARYFALDKLATSARTEWERDYPEAAQARADEADAREAAKQDRLSYSHVANQGD